MNRHIVLVGLPGSGKTTVGRLVALKLGLPFTDLDERIEKATGRTVTQLFQERGEPMFRMLEKGAMATAMDAEPSVIATGGGWAAQPGAIAGVGDRGLVIYMECPAEVAAARLKGDGTRPLLAGRDLVGRLQTLLERRDAAYRGAAKTVAAGDRSPEAVADEIAGLALGSQVVVEEQLSE